jgi:citrate lyase subunit beta / citryl-CoA lyase
MAHPRDILLGAQASTGFLPVCDHYSGVEARMRKSLQLQAELVAEFGACVFDASLDCEDGAPVGGERDHAQMVVALANEAQEAALKAGLRAAPRIAVRVHPVEHASFEQDVATIVGGAGAALCHLMIPKVESVADVERAVAAVDAAARNTSRSLPLPLQVLLESPAAVHRAFDIAAHPRVQSISFGLMDFVSAHGGAVPDSAMSSRPDSLTGELGQFSHPLVVRAKLDIASACHAHGKVPSHCVVTEFSDTEAMKAAARKAAREFGYTRMWSIHPSQIRPILEALAPDVAAIERAAAIIEAARAAQWAPVSYENQLHDRASYRYFWQVLERAHQTGRPLPSVMVPYFAAAAAPEPRGVPA